MFEYYSLKINIANNKHCKKMQNNLRIQLVLWQAHRLRGILADSKKNIPWLRKGTWRIRQKYNPPVVVFSNPLA